MSDTDAILERVVQPGGSGDQADAAAVRLAAARLPPTVLTFFDSNKVRIIACRGSVTDFATDLRGKQPRGWPPGMTWDIVPGTYLPGLRRVVIATRDGIVPRTGDGHGSFDLVLHEAMHGNDFMQGHRVLNSDRFKTARLADFASLGLYEQQAGPAGLQETYAESAARFLADDPAMAAHWPNLHQFWEVMPTLEAVSASDDIEPQTEAGHAIEAAFIGTVERRSDGTIALDLRAEGPDGAIGHAALVLQPGDLGFPAVASQLRSNGLETALAGPQLLAPFK